MSSRDRESRELTRRRLLSGAAGVLAGGSAAMLGSPAAAALALGRPAGSRSVTRPELWAQRAVAAEDALQRHFSANDGTGLYRERIPSEPAHPYSFLWPFSRVLVGGLALAGMPGRLGGGRRWAATVEDRIATLAHYWDRTARPPGFDSNALPPASDGGDKYYDDNAWIGLALAQHYRTTGSLSSLKRAIAVFDFVNRTGQAPARHPYPGGVYWVQQGAGTGRTNHDRTATSTAPNGELAFQLAQMDRINPQAYVRPAGRMQAWVASTLYDVNGSGLVYDKVRGDGTIDPTLWTYNQGALVAANVMRYRLTGEPAPLVQAEALAAAALEHFTQADFVEHSPAFNAIYFRGLLQLQAVSANAQLTAAIQQTLHRYAENVWSNHRLSDCLFRFPNTPDGTFLLINQAAVVQTFATLAWNAADYPKLA